MTRIGPPDGGPIAITYRQELAITYRQDESEKDYHR